METVQKVVRVLIIGFVMGGSLLFKTALDYIVIKMTPGDFFNHHNIFIYIIYQIINGVFLGVLIPILLKSNGVLLKYEYLFLEDFKEI